VVVALGNRAAGHRNQVRLLLARQRLAAAFLHFVGQHGVDPALQEAGAHALDGIAADVEGLLAPRLAPVLAQFEQHLGARAGPGAGVAAMDDGVQAGAIPVGSGDGGRRSWRPGGHGGRGGSRHEALLSCA
jgi:hypothetical protein